MKKYLPLFLTVVLLGMQVQAQDKKAQKYARSITEKDLYSYLSVLASDSLEGRETGERGQKMAADYIQKKFQVWGLEGPVKENTESSYYQSYPLKKLTYKTAYIKKGEETKENLKDFLYYSRSETMGEEYIDVVFIGEESMETLKTRDFSGKYIAISNQKLDQWRTTMAQMEALNAAGVFMFVEDSSRYGFMLSRFGPYMTRPRLSLEAGTDGSKIILANPDLAEWMFGKPYADLKASKNETARIILNADMLVEEIAVENVLGFLKGSEKPEEVLVVTAHYDHIGISSDGQINNGADDDGSGTSAVLEIAQAFATAANNGDRPKRSILFMTVSGEEKGLLGSEYYTTNPVFPLENTVANLNVDMVGRVDEAHKENPFYIYLIGSDKLSQDLHQLSEQANKTYTNIELDYTYNDENEPNRYYYRSDHYNFVKNNVPIIFYFSGTHEDYHRPTDTIEKIHFEKMEKITRLIFFTAWEVANRDERVKMDEPTK